VGLEGRVSKAFATVLALATAAQISLAPKAVAQEVSPPELGCSPSRETGVVQGTVINEIQMPVERGVILEGPATCFVTSDSLGSFSFQYVPAGSYTIETGALGSAIFTPIPINVDGDTTTLTLRLEAYDVVSDCRSMPRCMPLLQPRLESELPENVDPLTEAGLRTGIAVAMARRYGHPDHVPCIVGATPELLEVLRHVAPAATDANECEYRGERPSRELLYHAPSGRRAFRVSFNPIERSEDEALGGLSVGFGRLAGLGHDCSYRRSADGWRLVSCRIVWIS
jgi:hypothetical protein